MFSILFIGIFCEQPVFAMMSEGEVCSVKPCESNQLHLTSSCNVVLELDKYIEYLSV